MQAEEFIEKNRWGGGVFGDEKRSFFRLLIESFAIVALLTWNERIKGLMGEKNRGP